MPVDLLRSELRTLFGRRRTYALLVLLGAIPILLAVAVKLSSSGPGPGEGPPFLDRVTQNGLFVAVTALAVQLPLFLPVAVGVVAGDTIAGEANLGTLRYLLAAPTGRVRLLLAKAATTTVFCVVAAFLIAAVGLLIGALLFPVGRATLLSGDTISPGAQIARTALVAGYVAISMLGLAAIGIFVSTLTDIPLGAMAAVLVIAIVSEILDTLPQVSAIHPYLLSHEWLAFGDFLRNPVPFGAIRHGLLIQAAYVALFGSLAYSRFTTKDVLS